jgi:hypothetical protein
LAYALVGSPGAVSVGTSGTSITPAYGQSPTATHLLVLVVNGSADTTGPAAPSGWTLATQTEQTPTGGSASIFYKIAAGSDAAPTVAGLTGVVWYGQLYEFSGNVTSSPLDRSGNNYGTGATSLVLTNSGGADAASGELVIYAGGFLYSPATASTAVSSSLNNGAGSNDVTNNATSTTFHYIFGYGVTTSNGGADVATIAFSATNFASMKVGAVASFKVIAGAAVNSNFLAFM